MLRRIPVLALVFAGVCASSPQLRAQPDPEFNGRKMSEWLVMLKDDPVPRKRKVAILALGQIGSAEKAAMPTVLGAVTKAVRTDASPIVREQAAVVIGQMKTEDALTALTDLTEAVRVEKEPAVRKELAVALARLGKLARPAVQPLTGALKDADAGVRAAAADALGRIGPDAKPAAPELLLLLKDTNKAVRQAAIFALGRVEPEDTAEPASALVAVLKTDPDADLRKEAMLALGFLGDTSSPVIAAVAAVLTDKAAEMRALAATTLGKFGPAVRSAETELTTAINTDADKGVRLNAVRTLCSGYGTDAATLIPLLTERLKDDGDFEVRIAIAEELGALGAAGKPALPALRTAQRDPQLKVRDAATAAIKAIERPTKPKK
jgi:HEAT repeat protein